MRTTYTYTANIVVDDGHFIDAWAEGPDGNTIGHFTEVELAPFIKHAMEIVAAERQSAIDEAADARLADRQEARHMETQK